VFNTVETAIPSMIERGQGGAIVLTSSTAGINGIGGPTRGGLGYTAAKHGVVGLMRSYANNLAPHSIRVNSVHPTGVNTPMVVNDAMQEFLESGPEPVQRDGQRAAGADGRAGGHLQRDRSGWSPTTPATSPASPCLSTPASPTRSDSRTRTS
jgi:NAD(P)-dependent dehydrogenase (short-subunit alcohol dehydrogenase family)